MVAVDLYWHATYSTGDTTMRTPILITSLLTLAACAGSENTAACTLGTAPADSGYVVYRSCGADDFQAQSWHPTADSASLALVDSMYGRGDGRMRFVVDSVVAFEDSSAAIRLAPAVGDSSLWIDADSLSRSIRTGEIVRRCHRPVAGGRTVTFCRDTKANERKRG